MLIMLSVCCICMIYWTSRLVVKLKRPKSYASEVFYIHGQKSLTRALHGFLKTRHHLFVVVNEYRETVGLLSLEDVIEALIGATIVDEFDAFDDLRAVAERNPNRNNQPERIYENAKQRTKNPHWRDRDDSRLDS